MEAGVRREAGNMRDAVERKRFHSTCYSSQIFYCPPAPAPELWHGMKPLFLSKTSNTDRRRLWLLVPSSMPFCPAHPRHDLHQPCFLAHSLSTLASALKHLSSLPTALASEHLNASLIFTHCPSSSNQFPLIGQESQGWPPLSEYVLQSPVQLCTYQLLKHSSVPPTQYQYVHGKSKGNEYFQKGITQELGFLGICTKLVEFIVFSIIV